MYIPSTSLCPTLPRPIASSRPRPNISLMKSSQWCDSAGLDAQAYPSPPMTDSPTSPKRQQFPEERRTAESHNVSSSFVISSTTTDSTQPSMASQVLPHPAGMPHQYRFGAHEANTYFDPRLELQPRPRAQSIPQYQGIYHTTAPTAMHEPLPGSQYRNPSYGGPMSISGSPSSRFPKASRRAKAHVARACQNCKKAHLSCDEARPCARCRASGKEATCVDVEHKKRGRPRLRDERGDHRSPGGPRAIPTGSTVPILAAQQAESYRVLRSQTARRDSLSSGIEGYGYNVDPRSPRSPRGQHATLGPAMPYYPPTPDLTWRNEPYVAFLNLDLRILKATDQLRSLLADRGDVRGRALEDFVENRHMDALHRLQNELREERTQREPTFLPGIFPGEQEQQAVQQLNENDVDRITQGYTDRSDTWSFLVAHGRLEMFHCRIRLARTSIFFATLSLQRVAVPSTHAQISGYPMRRQSIDMAASLQTHPSGPHGRDSIGYAPAGPSSPFAQSAPSSPFSTLPQHLITTLPTAAGSALSTLGPSPLMQDLVGGYFPRQSAIAAGRGGASMQPPPQPGLQAPRPNTAREPRRPEPLSGLQLPPLLSSSAPTTPLGNQFFEQQMQQQGSTSQPGSARRGSTDRPDDPDSEETNRKRRRLNIGEIIEK